MPVISSNSFLNACPSQQPTLTFTSPWYQKLPIKRLTSSLSLGIVTSVLALAAPVRALQVRVAPQTPQLGDTLSVVVQLDNPTISATPTVTVGGTTYPTFLIGANQFRALLPTTPLDKPGIKQIQVNGEGEVKNIGVPIRDRKFPVQRITLPPGKAGVDATEMELNRVAAFKKLLTPEKFWNGAFLKPNQGRISTVFGVLRYYNGKFANDYYHRGVDYAGGYGSPVIAPASGRVALVGRESQGFRVHGNVIGIDHGQGVVSIFMHLSRINVKEGEFVQAGQTIGAIGSTGASTGPHLHWGLYVQGVSVDPAPWRSQNFQ